MTQSGWKLTLEIITNYKKKCQDSFYCEGGKNVCGISLGNPQNSCGGIFFSFFLPPLTTDVSFMVAQLQK